MDECTDGIGSCAVVLDTYLALFSLAVVAPTARIQPRGDIIRDALLACKQDMERAIGHILRQA